MQQATYRRAGLCSFNVIVREPEALWELWTQACGYDGLRGKRGIPQLRAIVALHFHSILCHPQVIQQPRDMPAQPIAHILRSAQMWSSKS